MEKFVNLFNYKSYQIIIKEKKKNLLSEYHIGIQSDVGLIMWLTKFNNLDTAITSGRDYARIKIDKLLLSRKKEF